LQDRGYSYKTLSATFGPGSTISFFFAIKGYNKKIEYNYATNDLTGKSAFIFVIKGGVQ
jgi:hypothetical protein